jgi:hypothetical protein
VQNHTSRGLLHNTGPFSGFLGSLNEAAMTADLLAADLLAPMDASAFELYHKALVQSVLPTDGALEIVSDVGDAGIGKGMVSARDYSTGTRIFTEPPLVRLPMSQLVFSTSYQHGRAL